MSAGDRKKTACVTGGNGYIASALIKVLLENGFSSAPFHALKDRNALSVSQAYPVSKVLLEKAASRFAAEHGISLVTVCPVVTVGTAPARSARPSVLNCLSLLSGDEAAFGALRAMELSGMLALVHVEDLCRAELFVAEEAAAAGRYLCCGLNTTILEHARFLTEKYPQYTVKTNLLSGELLEKPRVSLVREAGRGRVRLQVQDAGWDVRRHDRLRQDLGVLPKL
ncbi:unnamed protein product [Miscanthus lutarioriparius]|uniref:Anthocyanidin reductase n=1 Tax=Miscanthus lutarioriparius TaxID=422564 RepID=A0A811QRF6_9POAL|nr:unnamed protein product [Miscanthus lutarioriparius]